MKKRKIKNFDVIEKDTGISAKTLFNWVEYGVYPMPDERIDILRKYLKVSCDDLFFGDDLSAKEIEEAAKVAELVEKRKEDFIKKKNKLKEGINEIENKNQLFLFEGEDCV